MSAQTEVRSFPRTCCSSAYSRSRFGTSHIIAWLRLGCTPRCFPAPPKRRCDGRSKYINERLYFGPWSTKGRGYRRIVERRFDVHGESSFAHTDLGNEVSVWGIQNTPMLEPKEEREEYMS